MFKNLKWLRIVPDQPGKGGWKTGFHSFQLQPINDSYTTDGVHIYRGRWRKDYNTQPLVPAITNDAPGGAIVAFALHPYVYPSQTDPAAAPGMTLLGHHSHVGTGYRYWDFTTGTLRESHLTSSIPATFLTIGGRCFAADGGREGLIFDDRTPAIHAQPTQNLGIGTPIQPFSITSPTVGNLNAFNISSVGTGYIHHLGSVCLNSPDPNSGLNRIGLLDPITIRTIESAYPYYFGAPPIPTFATANALTSNNTPFGAPGTVSITTGTSLLTFTGVVLPGNFAWAGLAINFAGYSFTVLTHGPNGAASDLDGNAIALSNVEGIILGVYNGPTLTNVPYTITGTQVLLNDSGNLQTINGGTLGYGQSTNADLVQVMVEAKVFGTVNFRNLGNFDLGNQSGTQSWPGPTYAYAWYDPESGHMSNISPLFQIPKPPVPTAVGINYVGVTPLFKIDSGMISYPTGVDATRFSHVVIFRTLSTRGSSTLYPIGSLQPFVGKVHPGSASTRGSWATFFRGWLGLPNSWVAMPPTGSGGDYYYDFSTDADLLLTAGFRAPQFTNEKPMVLLKGGLTEPGNVAYQAYWDRRLWVVNTQEPDVVAFSCDEAQCPLGVPEESFPPTNRLRITSVDEKVCGMRTIGEMLLITTERWAYTVVGNNESNYRLLRVSTRMGGVKSWLMDEFPSDIEGAPSMVYFLGADKIVYQWVPGGNCVPISGPIQNQLNIQLSSLSAYQFGSKVHCISSWGRRLVVVAANWLYFPFIWDVENQVWTKNAVDDGTSGFQPGCQAMATIYGLDPPVNEIFSNPPAGGGSIIVRSWIRDDVPQADKQECNVDLFVTSLDGTKRRKQLCVVNAHGSDGGTGAWLCFVTSNDVPAASVQMGPYPDPLYSIYGPFAVPQDSATATDMVTLTAAFANPPASGPIIGYRFGISIHVAYPAPLEIYAIDIGYIDYEEPAEVDP